MTDQWRDGNLYALYGPDHPNWKGGTSALNASVNADNRLYHLWKFPKLSAANFQCTRCNSSKDLCVHHDKEHMSTIIHKIKGELHYDASTSNHDLKRVVIEKIVDYHLQNDTSGVVLCYSCHEQEHASLNFKLDSVV